MAILLLLLILFLVFSIPAVQTSVAHKLTERLNSEYDTDIHVEKVSISYDAKVKLEGVFIANHHKDTLISAKTLETSLVNIPGLFSGESVDFGNITANQLIFRLRRYKGEDSDSFSIFLEKFDKKDSTDTKGTRVSIDHIMTTNSKFSYVDENNPYPDIIALDSLNIDASNLVADGPEFSLNINKLQAHERRGMEIEDLSTNFSLSPGHMDFDDFSLETPNSTFKTDAHFTYKNGMADFENRVHISADLKKSSVSTTDLAKFYDKFEAGHQLDFHGKMEGTLNDFELNDFILNGMDRTHIDGNIALKNIFEHNGFRVNGDFNNLTTNYYDLVNLLPGILKSRLPQGLNKLGNVKLRGKASATTTTVSANAVVNSQLGRAKLDATLAQLNSTGNETYRGKVSFEDFNLGRLLGNPALGLANFDLKIDGQGFDSKDIDTHLDGTISTLNFNDYAYHDIEVSGILKNLVFNGELISRDPNLKLHFNGLADVSGSKNNYDFTAKVDYANLYALNFVKDDSIAVFKGNVKMDMDGTSLDDVVGSINFENASYQNREGLYDFKELSITSSFEGEKRKITINSPDVINGYMEGRFNLKQVPALFENAIGNLYSNYSPIKIEANQYLDFDFAIHNKIVQAIFPDIALSPGTSIKGSVESRNSLFKLTFRSPKITAYKNQFDEVNLQLDNTNPLFNTYLNIDSVSTKYYNFSKVHLISTRSNDTLFLRSEFKGGTKNNDEFNLNFYHTINKENQSVVGIRRSNLKFKETTWLLNKGKAEQTLVFDHNFKDIKLDTLVMSHDDESIAFSGIKKGSDFKDFNLNFTNVDLNKVTPSIRDFTLEGILNGKLRLNQKKGVYYPSTNLSIKDFAVNAIDYGDLKTNIKGNKSLTSYNIDAKLTGDKFDYMTANGVIDVGEDNPSINLDVNLNKFKLGILNAVGGEVISNIRGTTSGQAQIRGNYKKPAISGDLKLEDAGMNIPYLNVDLAFDQNARVKLSNQQFYFDHINFEDTKFHTKGSVDGAISHTNFADWKMDLDLDVPKRLLVLDTRATEESLYYGTAFISGNASIKGPFDELVIDVSASTEKGTVFKIPLNDTETIGNNSYIYFLTRKDKKARKAGKDIAIKNLKGLELNFDLDVTNDAEVEIVVDKKSGSTLRGSGAGTLLMEINTNGKFNMWGDFVVYHGIYNFKYAGLAQKEFKVVPGGNITWDGSPSRAHLNVKALYQTEANPASLLENPTINRSIPVNVYVNLNGKLSSTDISFDLEYPNLSSVVKSELEYRISDRANTELQALSLIAQGTFFNQYGTGNNAHPTNILFERASGIFDDIFSDKDDKFKVGVNYTQGNRTPDQDIADRVGVTLSTKISERILINGRVGVPIGGLTRSVVVGNVEIEFLLNKEGTLRAKIFNRESDIQYIGEELGYTQGVGISYSVDFDTFKELIHKILNKKMKVKDIPENVEKDKKKSLVPDYIKFPGT